MTASIPHLHQKGGFYYARVRVPNHLRHWLDQRELQWSLRTAHLKTARLRLLIAVVRIHSLFGQVEMKVAHEPLTEKEKIRIKNRIEEIKLEHLRAFREHLNQSSVPRDWSRLLQVQGI